MTATPTIADQVAELRAARPSSAGRTAFDDDLDSLRLRNVDDVQSHVGSPLPEAELIDAEGAPTSVDRVRSGRPAVIVFYRGAWCPYCNIALRTYREQLSAPLAENGIALAAISPQTPDGSMTMRQKHDLDFAVLSDPGNRIATSLGILSAPGPEALDLQKSRGLDLTAHNADGTAGVPLPTVALLDADGVLRWIDVHPDHTTRSEPQQILDAVAEFITGHERRSS